MAKLPKAVESLAVGMNRIFSEWVSSCLFGALIIIVLAAGTGLYILLTEFTHIYDIIVGAFQ